MESIITFIQMHWDTGLAALGGLVAVASTIVKATPSLRDDAVLAKVIKALDYFSVFNPKKPKPVDPNADTEIMAARQRA